MVPGLSLYGVLFYTMLCGLYVCRLYIFRGLFTSSYQVTKYDRLAGRFLSFSPAVHSAHILGIWDPVGSDYIICYSRVYSRVWSSIIDNIRYHIRLEQTLKSEGWT